MLPKRRLRSLVKSILLLITLFMGIRFLWAPVKLEEPSDFIDDSDIMKTTKLDTEPEDWQEVMKLWNSSNPVKNWIGTVDCPTEEQCTFTNLFAFNNSLHVFLGDRDDDGIGSSSIPFLIGLPTDMERVYLHRGVEPTDLLLRESIVVEQPSSIVSIRQCRGVPDAIDILAAMSWSNLLPTRIMVLFAGNTIYKQVLEVKSTFDVQPIFLSKKIYPVLIRRVTLGIYSEFWNERNQPQWSSSIFDVYQPLIPALQSLPEYFPSSSGYKVCVAGTYSFEMEDLSTDLKPLNMTSSTVIKYPNPTRDSTLQMTLECNALVCKGDECIDLLYFVKPNTDIIVVSSPIHPKPYIDDNILKLLGIGILHLPMNPLAEIYLESQRLALFLSSIAEIKRGDRKFLLFMPWEQLNNQLIGLKSSCAMARVLNRTLVLPLIGQRKPRNLSEPASTEWDFTFSINDLVWSPISRYFDEATLEQTLPCSVISLENFETLMKDPETETVTLDHVVFNPVAKATSTQQIQDYYTGILNYTIPSIDTTHLRMSQLTDTELLAKFGSDNSQTLALGSAFWMYGFNRFQPYPLTRYENYMDDNVYAQTVKSIIPSARLANITDKALKYMTKEYGSLPFVSIHVRRGDYWNKCKRIQDVNLQRKCYPSDETIRQRIEDLASRKRNLEDPPVVYVATNTAEVQTLLEPLKSKFRIIHFNDIFHHDSVITHDEEPLDPIDAALLDIELCSKSTHFIGNFYSSFSRAIFEKRELSNLTFETF
ncbi:hypothetical protein HDU99_001267 [Rhizoclosmatium hyalinum]|nr:hypothetical protein HDU99_001267 [Rhizoclosmatium hyalinum]